MAPVLDRSLNAPSPTSRLSSAARIACLAALLLSLGLFARNCWTMRLLKIDDAYITYRFAARLAHEGTLRWNLLEPPVEGYTSFLAVLISAVFERLGLDTLLCWKVLGVLLMLGGAAAAAWGAREFCAGVFPGAARSGIPLLVAALWCANPAGALHAMSGMETALFTFLLTALTALAIHLIFRQSDAGHPFPASRGRGVCFGLLGAGFLLLGMTRPEGALWAGIAGLGVWSGLPRAERARFLRAMAVFFLAPGLVYFLARWWYFQSLLPSTFYVKAGGALKPGLGRLATYLPSHHEIYKYFRDFWFGPALAVVAVLAVQCFRLYRSAGTAALRKAAARSAPLLALALASAVCIAFFAHVHLLMHFAHRFLYPFGQTFWLVLILPAMAAAIWGGAGGSWKTRAVAGVLGLILAAGLIHAVWATLVFSYGRWEPAAGRFFSGRGAYAVLNNNTLARKTGYRYVGEKLEEVAVRAGRQLTLFHHNMGEMFYFAPHWDSIDPIGLVDAQVAKNGFSADHVFQRRPDLFLLPSMKPDAVTAYPAEFVPDVSRALFLDPRIEEFEYLGYYPGLTFWSEGRMHVLARRRLLEELPWLREQLTTGLDLRLDPSFSCSSCLRGES